MNNKAVQMAEETFAPTESEINDALYGKKKRGRIRVSAPEERTADGIVFASKHEMVVYRYWKALERSGVIRDMRRQVPFHLFAVDPVSGKQTMICRYVADFVFFDADGKRVVVDAKGMRTEVYKLKCKWFAACYGQRIVEM